MLRQRRIKKARVWLWVLSFALIVLVVSGAVYVVLYAGIFSVQSVEVINNRLQPDTVLTAALTTEAIRNRPLLGLIGSDNILFWIMTNKNKLLNRDILPSVESVRVEPSLFNRTLKIIVTERKTEGVFCANRTHCFAFDADGVLFAFAPRVEGALIFRVDGEGERVVVLGRSFLPKADWVQNVLNTVEILERNKFYISIVKLRDQKLAEWEAELFTGPTLYFSLSFVPSDFEEIIQTLSDRVDLDELSYVDFRVEGRIYYR